MKHLCKKLAGVLLAAGMVLSLAGCGGESGEGAKEPIQNSTETSGYEAKDMEGRTIRIGIWWDEYWDSNYQTLDDVEAAAGSVGNTETMQMKLDKIREIEKKWNCKIEWVNLGWDGIQESISTSVVAGTPECDIYLSDTAWVLPAIMNGYAQKFTDYAPADADVLNEQKILTSTKILGQDEYLFHESSIYPGSASYLAYNKEMVNSLGLEDPNDLAAKGEWTWDKFAEYCQKCTQDTDGNGTPDVYGYGSVGIETIKGLMCANNAELAVSDKEGLSSEASIQAFQFMDKLYNVDKTARPYTYEWNDDRDSLFNGQAAFAFVTTNELNGSGSGCDFPIYICPAPLGPNGDGSMTPARFVNEYFIPINVEDPTSVYCIFEEMQNWYNGDTTYRDDPEFWESMFETQEQLDLAIELGFKNNNDMWTKVDDKQAVSAVWNTAIVDKSATVAQAIEENKQILQSEIDMYNK